MFPAFVTLRLGELVLEIVQLSPAAGRCDVVVFGSFPWRFEMGEHRIVLWVVVEEEEER
jgi:hypothetical protein